MRRPKSHSRTRAQSDRLTAVDLFCGAGGLTLGLKQAGFQVLGAVDLDELAAETYRRNHRSVTLWNRDIRKLAVSEMMATLGLQRGELDLLAGCPPCQGFSTIRTHRRGSCVADERNELVFEFVRFVRVLRPRAVMLENVPGLSNDKRMQGICRTLTQLGYSWEKRIADAADFGVPQRRRRMLLVASRAGKPEIPLDGGKATTVRDAIGHLDRPNRSRDPMHNVFEERAPHVVELIRRIPKNGGSRSSLDPKLRLDCHVRTDGFYDVYGRMAWDRVAPTITSGCTNPSKGRFLHPSQNRAITPREAALLQTFPKGYFISMRRGKEHAAALVGNALPPRMIKVIACAIRSALTKSPAG